MCSNVRDGIGVLIIQSTHHGRHIQYWLAAAWQAFNCSRYHPQICMLPPLSSMHLVNCCVAPAQLLPQAGLLWEALLAWRLLFCASPGRGSLLLPPPLKRPVTAWPIVEPIATPLFRWCQLFSPF